MPKPGDRFGDFVLEHELGRGAMGVVWAAKQESLGREVALKVLGEAFAADPVWVARFRAEAGAAARLSHPGILPVYAVGETQGLPWFAMEKVEGQDLAEILGGRERPGWEEIARWVRDGALALEHAHAHGVVHRDIKPANLMRRSDGRIVLTDFGLAKRIGSGSLTTTGLLMGTPYYMSPELVAGDATKVGPPTDVYGLGVTLYELMAGRPPFVAENAVALIKRIAEEDPEPPSRKNRRVPRDLETIALVCLAKRPEQRYASAQELADDLERFLAHEPIARRRPGLGERLARFVRRNRLAVAVAGVAVAALAAVLLFFTGQMRSRETEYREQIGRLLAQADALADAGEIEKAEEIEKQVQELAKGDEEAGRAAALLVAHDFLEDLKQGREPSAAYRKKLEAWGDEAPAHVTLEAEPNGATVKGARFGSPEGRRGELLVPDGRELKAGLWRLHVSAPGRQTAVLTVLAPPAVRGRLRVRLAPDDASTAGTVMYAGAWFPSEDAAKAASDDGLERLVAPYALDAQRVSVRDYQAFVDTHPAAERAALAARAPPKRARPAASTDDEPVLGLTAEQAQAYAAWKGKRLPTDAELRNAVGPGRLEMVIVKAGRPAAGKGPEWIKRLVSAGEDAGRALKAFEGLEDWDAQPEWMLTTRVGETPKPGRWPSLAALRELETLSPERTARADRPEPSRGAANEERLTALRLARTQDAP